jgi:TolA-binding protein
MKKMALVFKYLFLTIILVIFFSSCIALRSDVEIATEKIRAEHNAKFRALADKAKSEIDMINQRLDEIEKTLQIDKKAQENKISLSFSTLDELKATIREINNRIDNVDITAQKGGAVQNQIKELEAEIIRLKEENTKFRENMLLQLDELKPVDNLTITPNGSVRLPEDDAKSYKQLVDITRTGSDQAIARRGWQLYSQKFPDSRECDVAYWIGETYFIEKSYSRAIEYFSKIEADFPGCQKQEASYLRTAYSLFYLDQIDVASKVLDAMKALYPKPNFSGQIKELRKMIKESSAKKQKKPAKKDGEQ